MCLKLQKFEVFFIINILKIYWHSANHPRKDVFIIKFIWTLLLLFLPTNITKACKVQTTSILILFHPVSLPSCTSLTPLSPKPKTDKETLEKMQTQDKRKRGGYTHRELLPGVPTAQQTLHSSLIRKNYILIVIQLIIQGKIKHMSS